MVPITSPVPIVPLPARIGVATTHEQALISFLLYRWDNPQTTCDYPFLAVAEDRTALLSLGDHILSFELGIPVEAVQWLTYDFGPTDTVLAFDLSTMQHVLDTIFADGAEFGLISFDAALAPRRLELSLTAQSEAEEGPEYLIEGMGCYQRLYRATEEVCPVSTAERAMLDVCVSTVRELAQQCGPMLTEPPHPDTVDGRQWNRSRARADTAR